MNMTSSLRYLVTSPPDRNRLVAEIWHGETMLAEVDCEQGELTLMIYPANNQNTWCIPCIAFAQLLDRAAKDLSFYDDASEDSSQA